MGETSSADGLSCPRAMTLFEATTLAPTSAPARTKSRRETVPIGVLDMRRPALLVLASPHFHGLRVAQDRSAFRVEVRSEEHTSELQSHSDLVCRLLLEKKK